ncbi:MAG: NAD(P)-binding domain-containing protein [Planctomycetaceae bacterium]|nr:NAD(P)-binding domain-containing protein [Planctomycetaceae bacterium]
MSEGQPALKTLPAIIIGGGQAGVSLSYCLKMHHVDHLILERDRPFADWHHRRWESFAMNTPNWMNVLPGEQQSFAPKTTRNAYGTLSDAFTYFDEYLRAVNPPLRLEEVEHVGINRDGSWEVATNAQTYQAENVIVCTGHAGRPLIPEMAKQLPSSVQQLHSSEYKSPDEITKGNVLIVGSGASGVQICEELAASGRFVNVWIAGSGNFTLPWNVLGISTYKLLRWLGAFKLTRESWMGRIMFPKLLRKGDAATPPSPRQLARSYGVRRPGRALAADNAAVHCRGGDVPTDDLTVVWCTGFRATYDFLDVYLQEGILDHEGRPIHRRGVAVGQPGLYFVGLRFQHTFVSQDIYGVGQDAAYVAEHIARRHAVATKSGVNSFSRRTETRIKQ